MNTNTKIFLSKILNTDFKLFFQARRKFHVDLHLYKKQCGKNSIFQHYPSNEYRMLYDFCAPAGKVCPHYFLQDLFVAKELRKLGANHVYDVGSRLDGYIAHLLAMDIHVTMIDVRPLPFEVEGLTFLQGNAENLTTITDESLEVVSSLHAIEHFGLGRYGDPVDYDGWKKGLDSIIKKIKRGGHLFLSVPIGPENVLQFNAHRIFMPSTIIDYVSGRMSIESFAWIHDPELQFYSFVNKEKNKIRSEISEIESKLSLFDCGVFHFSKQ